MTDPAKRSRLFRQLAELPSAQFEELVFALNPPVSNLAASSAPQADRVRDLLRWAESPLGRGLAEVAAFAKEMFGLDVPDFAVPPSVIAEPDPAADAHTDWKEHLGNGVYLEMMNIPARRFWMGSPESEEGRQDSEGPIHSVTVSALAMGKYPVTQAEWCEVAALPKVNVDLHPFPSYFKGDRLPVEQVNWDEAVEFCERLSRFADRPYRLPSEAEWEYACRARTNTPCYFGDTISTDQAYYKGNYTYGTGAKGEYREKTTEVGSFPANAFGLYDLHGNVLEWCQDIWHDSYQGAPIDGSAWLQGDHDCRMLRGGSWYNYPGYCRSANRLWYARDDTDYGFGFRVVCASSWTQ